MKITRQRKSTLRELLIRKRFCNNFLDWNDFNSGNTVKRCFAVAFHLNFQSPSFYSHAITINTLLDFNCCSCFPSLSYCSYGLVKGTVTANRRRVTEALYQHGWFQSTVLHFYCSSFISYYTACCHTLSVTLWAWFLIKQPAAKKETGNNTKKKAAPSVLFLQFAFVVAYPQCWLFRWWGW